MTASIFGTGAAVNVNVNGSLIPQSFTGAGGQTVFAITNFTYVPGTNSLLVFINGQRQILGRDFTETSSSSFTLVEGVIAGDYVDIIGFPQTTLTAQTALGTSFTQIGTGGIPQTVNSKLNQSIDAKDYGVDPTGLTDSYAAMVIADAAAKTLGAVLVLSAGTYVLNTSLAFTAPVHLAGGIISGNGTVSFPNGFFAIPYYCFDCLVGPIKSEVVYAEWFGAKQSLATPTSVGVSILAKAWNNWPSFITGAGFGTSQNYGNAVFLAANKPFANGDSWDFIAIQRALWSIGIVTALRGEVRLFAGTYNLSRAIRWVGQMASTLRGACRTKTLLNYVNIATHEIIPTDAGNSVQLINLYKIGPDPTFIADIGIVGPNGFIFGSAASKLYLVGLTNCNGVTLENCWITVGDADIYMEQSTNDIWIRHCMFEYGASQILGFDTGSWCQIEACGFWWSPGTTQNGVNMAGYAFISGCTFVSLDVPWVLGLGSHVSASTVIQRNTGYRTIVDGRTLTRHLAIAAGTNQAICSFLMAASCALTTRMRAGGSIATVGSVGIGRELSWYRDGAAPIAAAIVATFKWGNAGAQALITESAVNTGTTGTIQLNNGGAGGQNWEGDVTITIEGSDFVLMGL